MWTCERRSCAANRKRMINPLYPNMRSSSPKIGYVNCGWNVEIVLGFCSLGWTMVRWTASLASHDPGVGGRWWLVSAQQTHQTSQSETYSRLRYPCCALEVQRGVWCRAVMSLRSIYVTGNWSSLYMEPRARRAGRVAATHYDHIRPSARSVQIDS